MKNQVKRKFNFKKFFIFILVLVSFFALIIYGSKIKVKSIIVKGNSRVKDYEVIELARLDNYPSYITYNRFIGKKHILKNKLIKDVKIRKKKNFTIVIEVSEYKLLFNLRSENKIVASDGSRIDAAIEDIPSVINFVSEDILNKMIDKFSYLSDDVITKISEIEYSPNLYDNERFIFYMRVSNTVYVTLNKIKEFNNYNKIKEQIGTSKGILYLDSGNYFEIKD